MADRSDRLIIKRNRVRGKRYVLQHPEIAPGPMTRREQFKALRDQREIERLAEHEFKLTQKIQKLRVRELDKEIKRIEKDIADRKQRWRDGNY